MNEDQRAELKMYRAILRKQNALLDGRFRRLEDRVKELEEVVAFGKRDNSPTHDGRIVVDANEWERYQELRLAVLAIIPMFDRIPVDSEGDFDAMRAVLDAMKR